MIEIPLWIIGYAIWFTFIGLFIYGIIWVIREQEDVGALVMFSILLVFTILSGIVIGCASIWSCSEIVRFV